MFKPSRTAIGLTALTAAAAVAALTLMTPSTGVADPNLKTQCAPGQLSVRGQLTHSSNGEQEKRTHEQIVDAILANTPGQASLTSHAKTRAYDSSDRTVLVVQAPDGTTEAVFDFGNHGFGPALDNYTFCSTAPTEGKKR